MLDNGKAEARAADLLGVALVHAVEPLEHALTVGSGDADAVIRHTHHSVPVLSGNGDAHMPVFAVVLDRVVTEVEDHFVQHL